MSYFDFGGWLAEWESSWLPVVLLASFAAIIFNAIIISLAKGFGFTELERYSTGEFLQVLATLFLAIFLLSFLTIAFNAISDMFGASYVACGGEQITISESGPLEAVRCRIENRAEEMAELYEEVYETAEESGVFQLLSTYLSILGLPVFQGSWVTSWYEQAESFRILGNIATQLLISLNAQIVAVRYIEENMLGVILPLGIFFRAIPFTRTIGSFFISLSLASYFVFPVVFVLLDPGLVEVSTVSGISNEFEYCYPTFSGTATIISSTTTASSTALSINIENAASELSKFYFIVILHPLISLGLTIMFIKYLMDVFSAEAYELMRMLGKVV